jgi:hypothetical protein
MNYVHVLTRIERYKEGGGPQRDYGKWKLEAAHDSCWVSALEQIFFENEERFSGLDWVLSKWGMIPCFQAEIDEYRALRRARDNQFCTPGAID